MNNFAKNYQQRAGRLLRLSSTSVAGESPNVEPGKAIAGGLAKAGESSEAFTMYYSTKAHSIVPFPLFVDDKRRPGLTAPGISMPAGVNFDLVTVIVIANVPRGTAGSGSGRCEAPDWCTTSIPDYGGGPDTYGSDWQFEMTGPCQTGNPILDNVYVDAGFDALWTASNPNATSLGDRREQGAWIVQMNNGSYRVIPWNRPSTICGIDAPTFQDLPPQPDGGVIVAFVHTHPYGTGEMIPICGESIYQTAGFAEYAHTPSDDDRNTSLFFGSQFWPFYQALDGYVLDKDGIVYFKGWDAALNSNKARCGY